MKIKQLDFLDELCLKKQEKRRNNELNGMRQFKNNRFKRINAAIYGIHTSVYVDSAHTNSMVQKKVKE